MSALLGSAGAADAAPTFERVARGGVAENGFTFTSFDGFPGLNNNGQVLFGARYDDNGTIREGLFRADVNLPGSPIVKLLDNTGIYANFTNNPASYINDAGFAAATVTRDDTFRDVIRVGPTGGVDVIASTAGAYRSFNSPPSINASGTVAFFASMDSDPAHTGTGAPPLTRVMTAAPGGSVQVREDATAGEFEQFGLLPLITDDGKVTYFARKDGDAGSALVTDAADGSRVMPLQTGGSITSFIPYDVNNHGDIAFAAREVVGTTTTRSLRLYDAQTGDVTTIANESTPGASFVPNVEMAINDRGTVVFSSTQLNDDSIFVHTTSVQELIGIGDPLFGSTVSFLSVSKSLNDLDQVVFYYSLANGEGGFALATVPEPSAAVAGVAGVGLLLRRRNRTVGR